MTKRPRRRLDYEALALASKLIHPDFEHWDAMFVLRRLGVDEPNSHEKRLFRRAVYRLRKQS